VPTAATPWRREDPAPGVIHLELHGMGYGLGLAQGTALKGEIREMARFLREDWCGPGGRDKTAIVSLDLVQFRQGHPGGILA